MVLEEKDCTGEDIEKRGGEGSGIDDDDNDDDDWDNKLEVYIYSTEEFTREVNGGIRYREQHGVNEAC